MNSAMLPAQDRLIKASTFAKRYFADEDAPDLRTVRAWVEQGLVPGAIIGSNVYVNEARWQARPVKTQAPAPRPGAYRI